MNGPHVSVLLSVRNGMAYLPAAIESIQAQSLENWQLVVNDNASTDGSVEYLERQLGSDPRVVLILNDQDLGHSGGLNRGLQDCSALWVARMDADDRALPQRLERQLQFVRRHPGLVASSCLAYHINERGNRVGRTAQPDLATEEGFRDHVARGEAFGLLHPGAIIRRADLEQAGGYRPKFDPASDADLWMRLSERGSILVQQERLLEYRIHSDSDIAVRFRTSHLKYQWARECWRARRAGRAEPSLEQFKSALRLSPWHQRANHARKREAKRLYREAGLHRANGRTIRTAFSLAGATALQPRYALTRAWRQVAAR